MQHDQGFAGTYPIPNRHRKRLLRVFLVEDLPVVRNRIVESLGEIDGLEVAGFAEGEESALSWLGSNHCDVLILDLELRQGNGLGVLRALASADAGPGPTKIVYSNHASANIRRVAVQLGASYFLDKTLDTPKLRPLLEELAASAA
jgi:DNA-binding NarL/FixJ family response regulator